MEADGRDIDVKVLGAFGDALIHRYACSKHVTLRPLMGKIIATASCWSSADTASYSALKFSNDKSTTTLINFSRLHTTAMVT